LFSTGYSHACPPPGPLFAQGCPQFWGPRRAAAKALGSLLEYKKHRDGTLMTGFSFAVLIRTVVLADSIR